jgi:dimethylamine monooxygenase subunit A
VTAFAHAPYASGKPPFSIGLTPLDPADWIEADALLAGQLALKQAILAAEFASAFAALEESAAGQGDVLELLAAHLPARFPKVYRREATGMRILPADRCVALAGEPPLLIASRLVQEDLLLMRRDAEGWRLVAGSLCFPSTWLLREKMGRAMEAIHAPVPGYNGQMGERIARIFDNLQPDWPLERFNWSIYGDDRLRHAQSRQEPHERFPVGAPVAARAHIRIERQTLRRLARSGDILFTVRIHADPFSALVRHPNGRSLAAALRGQVAQLTSEQLAYKGLSESRERLLAALAQLA